VGVFWALLFLSAQGRVELYQEGGLFGALQLRLLAEESRITAVGLAAGQGSDGVPALESQAA
jgi:segregation and condensation protein A